MVSGGVSSECLSRVNINNNNNLKYLFMHYLFFLLFFFKSCSNQTEKAQTSSQPHRQWPRKAEMGSHQRCRHSFLANPYPQGRSSCWVFLPHLHLPSLPMRFPPPQTMPTSALKTHLTKAAPRTTTNVSRRQKRRQLTRKLMERKWWRMRKEGERRSRWW